MRDVIATREAPQAIGPYSQAIRAGGFVFAAPQLHHAPVDEGAAAVLGRQHLGVEGGVAEGLGRVVGLVGLGGPVTQ